MDLSFTDMRHSITFGTRFARPVHEDPTPSGPYASFARRACRGRADGATDRRTSSLLAPTLHPHRWRDQCTDGRGCIAWWSQGAANAQIPQALGLMRLARPLDAK